MLSRFTVFLPLAFLSCHHQAKSVSDAHPARSRVCVSLGQSVDSAFAVNAARKVLRDIGQSELLEPVKFEAREDWDLVTLEPTGTRLVTGGGGLVWVDRFNGCAVLLRRFE